MSKTEIGARVCAEPFAQLHKPTQNVFLNVEEYSDELTTPTERYSEQNK